MAIPRPKIDTRIIRARVSDPLNQFYQIEVKATRDDGRVWTWKGVPESIAEGNPYGAMERAISSVVAAMLDDHYTIEFVKEK